MANPLDILQPIEEEKKNPLDMLQPDIVDKPFHQLDYYFDTNLDYTTDSKSPYSQMLDSQSSSVFTDSERRAIQRKGPIGIGEAFQRTKILELIPFSPFGVMDAWGTKDAVKRLQADKYGDDILSKQKDSERVMKFLRAMEEEQIRGFSWGASVYGIASHMPAFMGEFAFSGGIASLGKGIIKKGAITAAKGAARAGAKGIARGAFRAAKYGGEVALRTPVMYNLYAKGYAENQIFANIALTDKGVAILEAPTESRWSSLANAYADAFIEVGSELLGSKIFRPHGRLARKTITRKLSPEVRKGVEKFMRFISADGKITRAFRKGGFDGIIEEIGEEVVGDQLRAAFGITDFSDDPNANILDQMRAAVPGWDDLSVMAGAFSIPGVSAYSSQKLYNKLQRRGVKKADAKKLMKTLSQTEKDSMLQDFLGEENEWLAPALQKAMAGQKLTTEEQIGLNEKFYDYLDKDQIDVAEAESKVDIESVADISKKHPFGSGEWQKAMTDRIIKKLDAEMEIDESDIAFIETQLEHMEREGVKELTEKWAKYNLKDQKGKGEISNKQKAQAIHKAAALESLQKEADEFKSNVRAVVAAQIEDGMPADKIWKIISKTSHLKGEEIAYSGLEAYIKSKKDHTQKDILDFIDRNKVKIKIVFRGDKFQKFGFNKSSKYYKNTEMRKMIESFNASSDTDEDQFRLMLENTAEVYHDLMQFPELVKAVNEDADWAEIVMKDLIDQNPKKTRQIEFGLEEAWEILQDYELTGEQYEDATSYIDRARTMGSPHKEQALVGLESLLQEHANDNRTIQEIGADFMAQEEIEYEGEAKHERWTLDGGNDYMEVLITLPTTTANQEILDKIKDIEKDMSTAEENGDEGLLEQLVAERGELREQLGEVSNPRERLGDPRITLTEDWEEGDPIRVKLEEKGITKVFEYVQHDVNGVSPTIEQKGLEDEQGVEYKAYAPGGVTFVNPILGDVERWLADQIAPTTYETSDKGQEIFTHYHWEEKNVIFFMRINFREDRDGNKVLFIEELQSDWHGKAREVRTAEIARTMKLKKINKEEATKLVPFDFGYSKGEAKQPYSDKEYEELLRATNDIFAENDNLGFDNRFQAREAILENDDWKDRWEITSKEDRQVIDDWREANVANRVYRTAISEKVPDAPMKDPKVWRELGIKKAIAIAIQTGATKVAWINGEQSAKRYNLWSYFKDLTYQLQTDGTYYIFAKGIEGSRDVEKSGLSAQELIDHIGEDNFERVQKLEGEERITDEMKKGKLKVSQKKHTIKFVETSEGNSNYYVVMRDGKQLHDLGRMYEGSSGALSGKKKAQDKADAFNNRWYATFEKEGEAWDGKIQGVYETEKEAQDKADVVNYEIDNPMRKIDAEGRRSGGEKHLDMYDRMLPSIVKKYIKKWDAKVEMVDIGDENTDYYEGMKVEEDPANEGQYRVVDAEGDMVIQDQTKQEAEKVIIDFKAGKVGKQMGFEITPMMKLEVQEIGQSMFGKQLAEGVTGEDTLLTPKIVVDAMDEKTPEGKKKLTKETREQKYLAMVSRISEIMKSKADLKDKKAQLKETLDYFAEERKQYQHSIKRYEGGKLDEEYNALPKYYRGTKGSTLDEAAANAGHEGDMAFRDYLIQLEQDYASAKEAVDEVNAQIRESNEKAVIKTEIAELKQRVKDFEQGKKQGTKDLATLRREVTAAARKLLPASGKRNFGKILSAINSIKNEGDVGPAIAKIVDNYENYIERLIRAKAVKQILKRYKKPQNILDVKYREKIEAFLDTLTDPYDVTMKIEEGKDSDEYYISAVNTKGEGVGLISFSIEDGEIHISSIEVKEEYRRMGIGTKIIDFIDNRFDEPIDWGITMKDGSALKAAIEKGKKAPGKRTLQRKALAKMTTEELVTTARRVGRLIDAGKLTKSKKDEMKQMASEIMRAASIKASGGRFDIENIESSEELKKAWLTPLRRDFQKYVLGFTRPLRLIRKIFGDYGERMFYDVIEHAETLAQHLKIKRLTKIDEIMKKHGVKIMDIGKSVTIDGATYRVNNLMTMYAQRNNKEGRAAIIHGNKIKEETYEKFISYLEKEYPSITKAVDEIKIVVGDRYDEIRATLADSFNVSLERVLDYFPITRARIIKKGLGDPDAMMASDAINDAVQRGHKVNFAAVEKGLSIKRKDIPDQHQTQISMSFMEDAARAIDNQEHLIHFAGVQKMWNDIKQDTDLQRSIKYNHSNEALQVFYNWMDNAINPRMSYRGLGWIGERVKLARRSLGIYYLGFNVITAMKQFPSAHLALKYTSFTQLYESMAKVFDPALQKRILELDPTIQNRIVEREIGEIMQGVSRTYENDFLRQIQMTEQWLGEKSMKMILNMDRWAVMSVFDAVYQSNKNELGHEKAVKLAHKAILETQPQGRRIDLPQEYRTNDELMRMILMFTNQLNQIFNMMVYDAPAEFKRGDKDMMMRGIASIMLSNLMIYGVSHGGWDWPDDDEEQWRAWTEATLGSQISSIPIAGGLAMSTIKGFDANILTAQSKIDDFRWKAKQFKNEQYAEAAFDIMIDVAVLTGRKIPYGATRRTIKGIKDFNEGSTADPRRLIWSSSALYE